MWLSMSLEKTEEIKLPVLLGITINKAAAQINSKIIISSGNPSPAQRDITAAERAKARAEQIFPTGAKSPAIRPPKAYAPLM